MSHPPAAVPAVKPDPDPRFERTPTVRHALSIHLPMRGRVTIHETATGGRVVIQEPDSSFEKAVALNVRELRTLAQHANAIARRVAKRPGWMP
jgi:hypothetical protein